MTAARGPARQMRASGALALGCLLLATSTYAADTLPQSIAIRNGTVPPVQRVLKAAQQSTVHIEWTADRPMTVHLEGYDITVVVRPGQPAAMQFKAHAAGRFAVHAHAGERQGPSSGHAHGRGALLRLEVHPQ